MFKQYLGKIARTFLVIGALSVSAFAAADDYYLQNGCVTPCAPASCSTSSCCCGEPCCEPPACGWAYNPPAYCRCNNPANCCNNCDGFGIRLDFLWWRSCVTGVALGTEEEYTTFPTGANRTSALNRSHLKKPDFKFDPGFRLGFANYCDCGYWDIALNWTHYHTTAHAHGASFTDLDGAPVVTFLSFWERGINLNPQEADARYALNLDLLDLEFGRKYFVSNCFSLRPHFGLRGARINQDYKVFTESFVGNAPTNITSTGIDFTTAVKARNNFLAIGPRVGLEAQIHLGCGFSLVGEAAGSLVYGSFSRHSKEVYTDYFQGTTINPFAAFGASEFDFTTDPNVVNNFEYEAKSPSDRCSRAFTDLSVGIKWERCFDWCNRLHPVGIEFTWEHHAFYNMSNFNFASRGINFQAGTYTQTGGAARTGDIFTQGLTVKAKFGF